MSRLWAAAAVVLIAMPMTLPVGAEDATRPVAELLFCRVPDFAPCEAWVAHHAGPGGSDDKAWAVAWSPDGSLVYAVGTEDAPTGHVALTVAYDAATGDEVWAARHVGDVTALLLSVTAAGGRVFVAGATRDAAGSDALLLAYDGATGDLLWSATHDGSAHGEDVLFSVAASADGSRVFAAGASTSVSPWAPLLLALSGEPNHDALVLAYDGATGDLLWSAVEDGGGFGVEVAYGVALAADGSRVFATGQTGHPSQPSYLTLAYDATTGARAWSATRSVSQYGFDVALAVDAEDDAVAVTGFSAAYCCQAGYADVVTVLYDAATGAERWVAAYDRGGGFGGDVGYDVLLADGRVHVAAGATPPQSGQYQSYGRDFAVLTFDLASGALLWMHANGHYSASESAFALGLADGLLVAAGYLYASATGYDAHLAAFHPATGALAWNMTWDATRDDHAIALAVAPDGLALAAAAHARDTPVSNDYGEDWVTLLFEAPDGTLRWTAFHDSPSFRGSDAVFASALAPDGGRLFLIGHESAEGGRNGRVAALEGATGIEQWSTAPGVALAPRGLRATADALLLAGELTVAGNRDLAAESLDAATGARNWRVTVDGLPGGNEYGSGAALAPDASTLYLAAGSTAPPSGYHSRVTLAALDVADGALLWRTTLDLGFTGNAYVQDVAVAPDGASLFVALKTYGTPDAGHVLAVSTADGALRWHHEAPRDARRLAVAPDGSAVYAAFEVPQPPLSLLVASWPSSSDAEVVKLDASDGAVLWTSRFDSQNRGWNLVSALLATPDGSRVVAAASGDGVHTFALDASTGLRLWTASVVPTGYWSEGWPAGLALTPDGTRVVLAASLRTLASGYDIHTVAYDTTTGVDVWSANYDGESSGTDRAAAVHVGPSGRVHVTGTTSTPRGDDWLALAYEPWHLPSL